MASYIRTLDHVEKIDDNTVKIVMNQPFSPIGHMLHKIKVLSQKEVTEQGEDFGKTANKAGTGPYMWPMGEKGWFMKMCIRDRYRDVQDWQTVRQSW